MCRMTNCKCYPPRFLNSSSCYNSSQFQHPAAKREVWSVRRGTSTDSSKHGKEAYEEDYQVSEYNVKWDNWPLRTVAYEYETEDRKMIDPPQKKLKLEGLNYKIPKLVSKCHGNMQPNPFFRNGTEFRAEENIFSLKKFQEKIRNGEAEHEHMDVGWDSKPSIGIDSQCLTSKKLKSTETTNGITKQLKHGVFPSNAECSKVSANQTNVLVPQLEKKSASSKSSFISLNTASKPSIISEESVEPSKQKAHLLKGTPNGESICNTEKKWYEPQTFYPTYDEFKDLQKYLTYMESQGAHLAGIAKIVPPKEWIPRKQGYNPNEIDIDIEYPVQQNLSRGSEKGAFRALATSYPRIKVSDYVKLATLEKFCTPPHETYEELEELYWEQQYDDLREAPIYGADTCDSITDKDQKFCNIRHLDSLLTDMLDDQIPGVNMPYLYFGMWKATFSWHVEDMDLYAVNFLHYGAPKTWYCVPPQFAYKLEFVASKLFPDMSSQCKNMLRHKCCMISPRLLEKFGVRTQKMVQEERDMIVVFPHAYHSGFNHGFNIAESANVALRRWVEYGKRFRGCTCGAKDDNVAFNMEPFVAEVQPEKLKEWKEGSDWDFHPDDPEFLVRAYFDAKELFRNDEMSEKDFRRFRKDINILREVPEWYTKKFLTSDCLKCIGCENRLKDDCGDCEFCLDMPKFGGIDLLSQPCIKAIPEEDKKCWNPMVKKYEDKMAMACDHEWDISDLIVSEEEKKTFGGPRLRAAIRDAKENPNQLYINAKKLKPKVTEKYMEKKKQVAEAAPKQTPEDLEASGKKGGGKGVGFAGALSEAELLAKKAMSKCTKGKQHRFRACGKCEGCCKTNCGECNYCRDMPRFGGMGLIKQKCITRVCVNPVIKMCDACIWVL